jgi:hypothetical protein
MSRFFKLKTSAGVAAGIFLLAGALAVPLRTAAAQPAATKNDEFYIISSVDLKKDQLVLKRPTEVTVLMDVNDKTVCQDEKGKAVHLKDLRAGDTVFVNSYQGKDGVRVATRIRKGYMTVQEVRSRYLSD